MHFQKIAMRRHCKKFKIKACRVSKNAAYLAYVYVYKA